MERIEIRAGNVSSISGFQSDFTNLQRKISSTIDSLRSVQNNTRNISGGVNATLLNAQDSIQARINDEDNQRIAAENTRGKVNEFINTAVTVDNLVADQIAQNQELFFSQNERLRPPVPERRGFWRRVGDFFVSLGNSAWSGIVDFYNKLSSPLHFIATMAGAASDVLTSSLAQIFGISAKSAGNVGFANIGGVLRATVPGNNVINGNVAGLIRGMHITNVAATVLGGGLAAWSGFRAPAYSTEHRIVNTGVSVATYIPGKKIGAKIGFAVGKFIPIPIVGSVVGTLVGGVVGGAVGGGLNWLANNATGRLFRRRR